MCWLGDFALMRLSYRRASVSRLNLLLPHRRRRRRAHGWSEPAWILWPSAVSRDRPTFTRTVARTRKELHQCEKLSTSFDDLHHAKNETWVRSYAMLKALESPKISLFAVFVLIQIPA